MNEETPVASESTQDQPITQEPDNTSTSVQAETQTDTAEKSTNEESFFDPNQVPEELKGAYKQMQAAFTKKTQEVAKTRKEIEAVQEKAAAYAKYEQYIPVIEEMLGTQNAPKQGAAELVALEDQLKKEGYSDEAIQMMKISGNFFLNYFNQKEAAREQAIKQQADQAALTQKIDEAENLDPRLKDESIEYTLENGETVKFFEIVGRFVQSDPSWRNDPVASTKKAIALVDALIGRAKTEGKEELSDLARQKSQRFAPLKSSPQSSSSTGSPKTIQEAAALAAKQLGM